MADIFISYGIKDGKELAEYLAKILRCIGISVFIAPRDIGIGENFTEKIDKEIDECSNLIVILTESSCRSDYVKYEIQRAIIGKKRIIPCKYIMLDYNKIPDSIRDIQYFEFETKEALARRVIVEVSPETPNRGIPAMTDIQQVGIRRIFPNRQLDETNPKLSEELRKELRNNIINSSIVRMMGNSFRDFFGADSKKAKYVDIIREAISKGVKFQVMLLDPTSEAAKDRAAVEEGIKSDDEYRESVLFKDIERVTEWLYSHPEEEEETKKRIKNLIEVRYSNLTPTVFLILTAEIMFIEQYHIGNLSRLEQSRVVKGDEKAICLGGYVPFLMVNVSSDFARLMESHFENIWNKMQNNTLERVRENIMLFKKDPVTFRMKQFIKFININSNTLISE